MTQDRIEHDAKLRCRVALAPPDPEVRERAHEAAGLRSRSSGKDHAALHRHLQGDLNVQGLAAASASTSIQKVDVHAQLRCVSFCKRFS